MKKRLIGFILIMLIGGVGFSFLKDSSSYVLLAFNTVTVEMSIWTFLLLILLSFLLLLGLLRLLRGSKKIARLVGGDRAIVVSRTQRKTMAALIEFLQGNWGSAKHLLLRNVKKSVHGQVNYLVAAQCCYELNDIDGALTLLKAAQGRIADEKDVSVDVIRATMLFAQKRYEHCLDALHRIKSVVPDHPAMLKLLLDVFFGARGFQKT